jgi:hypothetical protein
MTLSHPITKCAILQPVFDSKQTLAVIVYYQLITWFFFHQPQQKKKSLPHLNGLAK